MRTIQESVEAVDAALKSVRELSPFGQYYSSPFLSGGIFTCTYNARSDITWVRIRIYKNGFGFQDYGKPRTDLFDKLSRKVEAYCDLYRIRHEYSSRISRARAALNAI